MIIAHCDVLTELARMAFLGSLYCSRCLFFLVVGMGVGVGVGMGMCMDMMAHDE